MDLDYLIVGRYQFDGRVFTARAQVLDLKSLRLSPETEQSGALVDLMEIQSNLAWNLLVMIAAEPPTSHEQFIQGFPRVRLDALENYVRGLLAPRRQDRVRHLREAVRLHPEYSQARLQLGKALFEARDYGGAAAAFARILQEDGAGIGPQAQFHLGLSVYYLGDFTRAADAFRSFAERAPLPEAFNNMGVAAARRGDAAAAEHFRRAVESAPKDPDYRFNLGVALYRTGDLKEAAQHLREAVTLQPGDAEAAALLQVISTPAGSSPPAAVRVPLERIRRTYDEADFRQLSLVQPGRP